MIAHCLLIGATGLLFSVGAFAHDAISAEARKATLARLDELRRTSATASAPAERATALIEIGKTLDGVRVLLNEDIISHGKTQGLETLMLVNQLNASPHKLQLSPQTRFYLSDPHYYRDALTLDSRGKQALFARFMLLKNHFYDSFVDNPLKPVKESKEALLEMITLGESLIVAKDAAVDTEEVHFILAIQYLKAAESGALPKAKCQSRYAELQKKFKSQWPDSLKLLTLEALSPS